MGTPGKVVRVLDEAAQAGLLKSAEHYRQNMRRFRAGLRPVG
jgi:carbonic anhydrase/acetyltransferase-like protein (isoleucine patch superfamily)